MASTPACGHVDDLLSLLTRERLAPYVAQQGGSLGKGLDLYVWNLQLAGAFHEVIAMVEVCLRNALNQQLVARFGPRWFATQGLFDDRMTRALREACRRISGSGMQDLDQCDPAKMVSEVTLGTWVQLLEKGGYYSNGDRRERRDYDSLLWRTALHRAFPNSSGRRADVLRLAQRFHYLRNRVAHHEPLFKGVPLRGQSGRVSINDAHDGAVELVGLVSTEARDWVSVRSRVPAVLAERP